MGHTFRMPGPTLQPRRQVVCVTESGLCDTFFLGIRSMPCMAECACTEECTCDEKPFSRECWSPCCVSIPCRNAHLCRGTTIQWSKRKRLCFLCSIQVGEYKCSRHFLPCPLCGDYMYMFQLKCNHLLCNDCLYRETKANASCIQCGGVSF